MLFYVVLFSMLISTTWATYGVDVSQPTSVSSFQCMKSTFEFSESKIYIFCDFTQIMGTALPLLVSMKKQVMLIQMVHKQSRMHGLLVWHMLMDIYFHAFDVVIPLNRFQIRFLLEIINEFFEILSGYRHSQSSSTKRRKFWYALVRY